MNRFSIVAEGICTRLGWEKPSYIGAGQFKEVYQTRYKNGLTVALKVFDPTKCNLCRAEREIAAMLKCESPVIGRLYDWGTYDTPGLSPHLYTLEEYFSGGALAGRVDELRGNVDDTLTIGISLLEGVSHLRERNLVHRDIKPDNIMFREKDGSPVLVDFGLVRDLSGTSLTHSYLSQGPGSPYYASPEQLNNEKARIDWRTDQFAVGVVLAICLTGMHPYGELGTNPIDVVNQVQSRSSHASTFVKIVQNLGVEFLLTMTSQWPVERFGRPAQAIDALRIVTERSSE